MPDWLDQLRSDLLHKQKASVLRSLHVGDRCARMVRRDGRQLINLASNDYLGLASHPRLVEAVAQAAQRWGVGAGSSRLVGGHLEIHERLEQRFAAFKHAQAALLTPTGYMANLAAITALAGEGDAIFLDKLCHASLIDAARMSGAEIRVFPHRNLDKLARLLDRYGAARRRLIVTDAVFSMDGDCADLPELCELRDRHEAILIVDEAHATGLLGATGSGLAEHQGVTGRVDVTISTAGKALGSLGGMITATRLVIDTIINSARSFLYTTAAPPTQAAAIDAALDVLRDEPDRRSHLTELSLWMRCRLRQAGWQIAEDSTPIIPLIVGDNAAALALASALQCAGYFAPAIRPPTVAPGVARVRLSLRSDLAKRDLEGLIEAIGSPAALSYE